MEKRCQSHRPRDIKKIAAPYKLFCVIHSNAVNDRAIRYRPYSKINSEMS